MVVLELTKSYPNTKKGRSEIPKKAGAYNLKNRGGTTVYTGMTKNLNQRIKQHHNDKTKHFSSASVSPTKTKAKAKQVEKSRLSNKKPKYNKTKK